MVKARDVVMTLALSELRAARRDLLQALRLARLARYNGQRTPKALDVDREAYRRIQATRLAAARRASTRSRRGALP